MTKVLISPTDDQIIDQIAALRADVDRLIEQLKPRRRLFRWRH